MDPHPPALRIPSLVLIAVFLATIPAPSQTNWTGAVSSDWSVAGNWSGGVPTSGTDVVIPSGTPNTPSTAGVTTPACRDLTVNAGATLTIASGSPLACGRTALIDGTLAGPELLRMVGATAGQLRGAGAYANLELAKNAGVAVAVAANVAVNGNLTQTTGAFTVSNFFGQTISVSGNAVFQGGTLAAASLGTIDVAGHVTFSGTSVAAGAPLIRCGGNWTSDAGFAPTSGEVVFDGAGAQSVTAVTAFPKVTVAAGSVTSIASLTANGNLTVDGTLIIAGALDANATVDVNPTGVLDVGGGTDTFAGNVDIDGAFTATGALVFDGGAQTSVATASPFPNVTVAKTGSGSLMVASHITVNGSLTQTSGGFLVSAFFGQTVSVSGNALFQGGALGISGIGVIDVAGSVTFAGTAVTSSIPTIRCGGNWTSDAGFAPTSGEVVFDGAGAQSVTAVTAFPKVTIAAGSVTSIASLTANGNLTVDGTVIIAGALDANATVDVNPTGVLDVGGGTDTFAGNVDIDGAFTATGALVFDGGAQTSVATASPFPNMTVAKTGSGSLMVASHIAVNGSLTQTSGGFLVSAFFGQTVSVSGNALFQGGSLGISGIGVIDVAGNVTFSGTVVTGGDADDPLRRQLDVRRELRAHERRGRASTGRERRRSTSGDCVRDAFTIAAGSVTSIAT